MEVIAAGSAPCDVFQYLPLMTAAKLAAVCQEANMGWRCQPEHRHAARLGFPVAVVRHVRQLLGEAESGLALLRWKVGAQRISERLEMQNTLLAAPIAAAPYDTDTVFAACKRALVTSQLADHKDTPGMRAWMDVVEAVEMRDLEVGIPLAAAYADADAEELGDVARYLITLAHWIGDLPALATAAPVPRATVTKFAERLVENPALGDYTDGPRLLERHVRSLLARWRH
eukprot:TRINITY_DN73961_c0_g1_i1.p1 TRINITY_DN73961_c0_g1~~TRINITY_DN73961_c0_g1_i1.p1  ORF type:complete len:240 (-),score=27.52 TRINITY_DN73961_c0_g1_i1:114-800(-)